MGAKGADEDAEEAEGITTECTECMEEYRREGRDWSDGPVVLYLELDTALL